MVCYGGRPWNQIPVLPLDLYRFEIVHIVVIVLSVAAFYVDLSQAVCRWHYKGC